VHRHRHRAIPSDHSEEDVALNWCRLGWHTWVYDDMDPTASSEVGYEERYCSRCLLREYGEIEVAEVDNDDGHTLATTSWSRAPPKKTK
jgi:hypothetical protein